MKKGIIGFIFGILATIGAQYVFPEYTTINNNNNGSGASSDSTAVKDSANTTPVVAAYPAATSTDTVKVKKDSLGSK